MNSLSSPVPKEPLTTVREWLSDAVDQADQRNPNAMTLATVAPDSRPSARIVLLKALCDSGGFATFYTNYASRKGEELSRNANAAAVLHWDKLGRQIRFEGIVTKAPDDESDAYFRARPIGSQLNAWASNQSQPLDDMGELRRRVLEKQKELGSNALPRPACWGGYRLWFTAVELWSEGEDRFHDRLRYIRTLKPLDLYEFETGPWAAQRLQP